MMDYALDSNTLSQIYRFYYKDRFPSFWDRFHGLISSGRAWSVSEVEAEMTRLLGLDAAVRELKRLAPEFSLPLRMKSSNSWRGYSECLTSAVLSVRRL